MVLTATQLCTVMLPIFRILPVGGVLLAILILVLALSPPDGSRVPLSSPIGPARGALVDRDRHAEARQFLIHAALKRADELNRLRELPDTPPRSADTQPKVAGLPGDRSEADPEETGSINEAPVTSIPIEIGELPTIESAPAPVRENPPAVNKKPEQSKPVREARRRIYRARQKLATRTAPPRQPSLFEILFGGQQYQAAYGSQPGGYQQYQQAYGRQQSGYQQYQQSYNSQQTNYQRYQPAYSYQQSQQYQQPAHGSQQQPNQPSYITEPHLTPY